MGKLCSPKKILWQTLLFLKSFCDGSDNSCLIDDLLFNAVGNIFPLFSLTNVGDQLPFQEDCGQVIVLFGQVYVPSLVLVVDRAESYGRSWKLVHSFVR